MRQRNIGGLNLKDAISMSEILNLVDKEYGYCQDEDMIAIMQSLNIKDTDRHLVDRRTMLRYFEYYATRHGETDYTKAIGNNGIGAKGAKYDIDDIYKVIRDSDIKERITFLFEKKTQPGPFGPVPKCIFHEYIEEVIGDGGVEEKYILKTTGMTKRQLDLMSVPDELLTVRRKEITASVQTLQEQIISLQNELAALQEEQEDIEYELNNR